MEVWWQWKTVEQRVRNSFKIATVRYGFDVVPMRKYAMITWSWGGSLPVVDLGATSRWMVNFKLQTSMLAWREKAAKSLNQDGRWPDRESSPLLPECKYTVLPLYQSALPVSIRTYESLTHFVFSLSFLLGRCYFMCVGPSQGHCIPTEKYLAPSHHMWPWQRSFFFILSCIKDLTLSVIFLRQIETIFCS
jgi:hypothetical protein